MIRANRMRVRTDKMCGLGGVAAVKIMARHYKKDKSLLTNQYLGEEKKQMPSKELRIETLYVR